MGLTTKGAALPGHRAYPILNLGESVSASVLLADERHPQNAPPFVPISLVYSSYGSFRFT